MPYLFDPIDVDRSRNVARLAAQAPTVAGASHKYIVDIRRIVAHHVKADLVVGYQGRDAHVHELFLRVTFVSGTA